jgi:uncharacterized protein YjbI with pentapeptide repeats
MKHTTAHREKISMRIGRMSVQLTGTVLAASTFLVLGIIVVIYGYFTTQGAFEWTRFLDQVYSNFGIELISVALTVLVIESFNQRRATRERKEELILQMGSPDKGFAVEGARILRLKGWLKDGSLREASLFSANLEGADLRGVHLDDADLRYANLHKAILTGANLQRAILLDANLQGAHLVDANLEGVVCGGINLQEAHLGRANLQGANLADSNLQAASLLGANLQGADLRNSKLQGVSFLGANLQGVNFLGARFDGNTLFPDQSRWSSDIDLSRFTDPNHPQFWRSPVYRGKQSDT